jgi:hypothetical protein
VTAAVVAAPRVVGGQRREYVALPVSTRRTRRRGASRARAGGGGFGVAEPRGPFKERAGGADAYRGRRVFAGCELAEDVGGGGLVGEAADGVLEQAAALAGDRGAESSRSSQRKIVRRSTPASVVASVSGEPRARASIAAGSPPIVAFRDDPRRCSVTERMP